MECHDVSSRPDGVNGHTIFKKAKIGAFLYSQSGNGAIKKSITKEMANSFQLLGQKKKCLEMISWHSMDDPVEDIFEFAVTRALEWYKNLIWG